MLAMGDSALRKEADAMTFVGCDLHTRTQQVAVLDTCTGEVSEHHPNQVRITFSPARKEAS